MRLLAAMVVSVGLFSACSKGGDTPPDTRPPGMKGAPVVQDGVVSYPQKAGQSMEAWEIVTDLDETFLNYSRFAYGTSTYQGQNVWLCYGKTPAMKYAGVGEDHKRLSYAMLVAGQGEQLQSVQCMEYVNAVAMNPRITTMRGLFDWVNMQVR